MTISTSYTKEHYDFLSGYAGNRNIPFAVAVRELLSTAINHLEYLKKEETRAKGEEKRNEERSI